MAASAPGRGVNYLLDTAPLRALLSERLDVGPASRTAASVITC